MRSSVLRGGERELSEQERSPAASPKLEECPSATASLDIVADKSNGVIGLLATRLSISYQVKTLGTFGQLSGRGQSGPLAFGEPIEFGVEGGERDGGAFGVADRGGTLS